jgi:hypothetical protein
MECPTCGIDNLPDTIRCECGNEIAENKRKCDDCKKSTKKLRNEKE